MSHVVGLAARAAVMTEQEGTVSGALEVTVDGAGRGLVRYRGTAAWLTIGNLEGQAPRTWTAVADLVAAVEASRGGRDSRGNTVPFEA